MLRLNIKFFLFLILLVGGVQQSIAKTYYFSSSVGDDSRSSVEAQNPETPWKTIDKFNNISRLLLPGDVIRFKCGDVFLGQIRPLRSGIANNPILFDQYGSGDRPVLTSMVELNDFESEGSNIFSTTLPKIEGGLNVLTIDGVIYPMGRFPNANSNNKGYLTIQSFNDKTITSNQLRAPADFTGAEIVIRKNNWIIDRHHIERHSGRNITYETSGNSNDPMSGYGFFIQNHPATLDQFGEWFFDSEKNKLLLYFDKGYPSKVKVEVATRDVVINIPSKVSNITFNNLTIKGSNENLIKLDHSANIIFDHCDLLFSGNYIFQAVASTNLTIENSKMEDALNGAIFLQWEDRGLVVRNNTFNRIFSYPGMGRNGEMQSTGIYMSESSSDGLIECNRFTNLGYTAINFNGNNTVVRNNLIDTYCTVKDDGAAIYTYTGKANTDFSNRHVAYNIILNGIGAVEGTKPYGPEDFPYVEGIYIDDNATGVEVVGNLIANVKGSGIYLHNARNIGVRENHIYNTGQSIQLVHDHLGDPIRNIRLNDNYLLNKSEKQQHIKVRSQSNDIDQMGEFGNNRFVGPRKDNLTFGAQYIDNQGMKKSIRIDRKDWAGRFGLDKESSQDNIDKIPDTSINAFGEINMKNGEFEFPVLKGCQTYDLTSFTDKGSH